MASKKTPEAQEYKVPITYLPYMGEKPESRTPPPTPHSRLNRVFYPEKDDADIGKKAGGAVSASKRADGIAQRGKTRGKLV